MADLELSEIKTVEKEWSQFFLRLLVILSVFEADRNFMIYTDVIARFKDVGIVMFFLTILHAHRWQIDRSFFRRSAFGWLMLYVIVSLPVSFYSEFTPFGARMHMATSFGWAVYLRVIYFCLLVYCARVHFQRHTEDIAVILDLFVKACVVFVVFNIVAYFYHFPFMTVFRPWPGRISNGYPTADAMMLLLALVTHLMVLSRRNIADFAVTLVLICGIFANATGSGIAGLGILGIVYGVANSRKHPGRVLVYAFGALVVLGAGLFVGYMLLKAYDPKDLTKLLLVLQARGLEGLSIVTGSAGRGNGVEPGSGSIAMRMVQYLYRLRYSETWFDRTFGLGAFYGYVENEFLHVVLIWGIVGLGLFMATLVESFTASLKENRAAMLYWSVVWVVAGMVLITTYLFSLFVPFALLLGAAGVRPLIGMSKGGIAAANASIIAR